MTTDWTSLPADILTAITKLLNSDLHLLRLRSVCSSWRTSLPLSKKRISFPLKVPSLHPPTNLFNPRGAHNGYFLLNRNAIYRLSPPDHASDAWIIKVSKTTETDANTFSLVVPLSAEKIKSPPGMLPKHLNILNYRISDICESYTLAFVNLDKPFEQSQSYMASKVIALWNYVVDCEFVALALRHGGGMDYWKLGDENWNKIHTQDDRVWFQDMFVYEGKCYAIDIRGVLLFIDSQLNATVVCSSFGNGYHPHQKVYLFEYKSDVYAVTKESNPEPEFYYDYYEDSPIMDLSYMDTPMKMCIFKKTNDVWNYVSSMGDLVLFLGDDASFCLSIEEAGGVKGNSVFLTDECFYDDGVGSAYGDETGVYDLDLQMIKALAVAQDYAKIFWPPPTWLMPVPVASTSGEGTDDVERIQTPN